MPFSINEMGALPIGVVMGWLLSSTHTKEGTKWQEFGAVAAIMVGGTGLDYLSKTNLYSYFWVSSSVGFFGYILVKWKWPSVPDINAVKILLRSIISRPI